jgi:hypothetical protein
MHDCLKQGDALSAPLLRFTLQYTVGKVQENQVELKLNGTHQLLAYAEVVNLLGTAMKRNTVPLTDASMKSCTKRKREKVYFAVLSPECRANS